ncbi:MAG: DNA photolyase family protein [Bacteroidetes bacterium]|nr:DNA photolyase family protein [Bacteroidota bacterium]
MVKILWFRKNLRLQDNKVLKTFLEELKPWDEILFLYIKNENSYKYYGEKRINFLNQCLEDLKNKLQEKGYNLYILKGNATDVFKKIIVSDTVVFADRQIEPYCIERDRKIDDLLKTKGSELRLFDDAALFDSGEVVKPDGLPYTVFTPFKNRCDSLISERHYSEAKCDFSNAGKCKEFITVFKEKYIFRNSAEGFIRGGRNSGLELLKEFYEKGLERYNSERDFPGTGGTSLLSPHLHFGTVSIRECYRAALKKLRETKSKDEVRTWLSELLWREFYYNITYHFPYVINGAFKKQYDNIKWSYDKELFGKWREGKTGYPIVDAGMRQLYKEGWMHNRLRMITAMFLTKDLFIDWKWGEEYFAEKLIDLDFSSNNGGWQWSASTGCDSQPYFRIFNPYLQSAKFDPEGKYIKKYVPELAKVPVKNIHQPDKMSTEQQKQCGVIIGKDYPLPVVEHSKVKDRVLNEFKAI